MKLIEPLLSDQALVADIEAADPGDGLALWWLGQSGFLVKSAAGRVLFDPYLSDSLTRKYEHSDKPHVRITRLAVAPGALRSIDVVTSSHNHTDHLDAETLTAVFDTNPAAEFVVPAANRAFVADRLGCEPGWPRGITEATPISIGAATIYAVPAAHNEVERDELGRCRFVGYVVRFGNMTVYHSGDTLRYPGMAELLRPFAIDVALLPINGNRSERRVAGNLSGEEAAQLAHDISARVVVPCHYEMFEFNTASPTEFVDACQRLGQPYKVLRCGERFEIAPAADS